MQDIKIEIREQAMLNNTRYNLYVNDVYFDGFTLVMGTVGYDLNPRLCKILNIGAGDYEAYQELIKKYLVSPKLTMEELEACIKKHNSGWLPNWKNSSDLKHFVILYLDDDDDNTILLGTGFSYLCKRLPNSLYMKNRKVADNVISELGEERIIKLLKEW